MAIFYRCQTYLELIVQWQDRNDPPGPRRPVRHIFPVLLQVRHLAEAFENLAPYALRQALVPLDRLQQHLLVQIAHQLQPLVRLRAAAVYFFVLEKLDVRRIVPVPLVARQHPKPAAPYRRKDGAPVAQLHAVPDVQHRAVLDVPLAPVLGRQGDAEPPLAAFDCPAHHQPVALLVHEQRARHGGECGGADEHRYGRFAVLLLLLAPLVRLRDEALHGEIDEARHLPLRQ